jgi:hypothetical protein
MSQSSHLIIVLLKNKTDKFLLAEFLREEKYLVESVLPTKEEKNYQLA